EKTMLASGLLAFLVRNERGERCQPFLTTLQQVPRGERVGEFLQAQRMATLQEGVGTRLKIDSLFPHSNRQPVVLVEADSRGKWEIGTHAHEHPAPVRIVHVEVILIHPALLVLQMRAIVVLVPNRHQDACWLPCLQDRHHLVGFGILEILLHELVSPALVVIALGSIQKRNAPFFGSVPEPILELIGDFRQAPPGDPFPLPIGVEKAKYALGLLEWLYQSIQQHAIKAAVPELNAILVMLDEGVHSPLLCGEIPGAYRRERLRGQRSLCGLMGYQGRSPWLVRRPPMNVSLSPFVAGWLALACTIAGLAIYRKFVSTREDDMLHILHDESHRLKQAALAHRLDLMDHWGKILTVVATVYGVLLAVGYFCQVWMEGFRRLSS